MTLDRRDLLVRTGLLVGAGALAAAGCRSDEEAATKGAAKAWTRGRSAELRARSQPRAALDLPARAASAARARRDRGAPAAAGRGHGRVSPRSGGAAGGGGVAGRGLPGGCSRRDRAYRVDNDGPRPALRDPRARRGRGVLTTEHDFFSTHDALRLRAQRTGATIRKVGSTTSLPSPPRMRSSRTSATPSRRARGRSR